jgi:lipopolysaccharide transport system ATP-binding protein
MSDPSEPPADVPGSSGSAPETAFERYADSHYAIIQVGDRYFGVALDDLPFDIARLRAGECRRAVHEASSIAAVAALVEADPWAWSNDPAPPVFRPSAAAAVGGAADSRALIELCGAVVSVPMRTAPETLKRRLIHGARAAAAQRAVLLHGIDLVIRSGERVGIVGRNGSGKTTLLKAITGIYPLAGGTRRVVGSMAPVIAQGIGFDPELSVRINIKLALAHTGRLAAYSRTLEAAVLDFAELRHRAEVPIQLLSSGQQARLAFAITLFETPDILILDEVFATGDAAFLRRAAAAMSERIQSTPIAILVSHDPGPIASLCNRCVLMAEGRVVADGAPDEILAMYETLYRSAA